MTNKITHRTLTMDFEVWEQFEKQVNEEIGELAAKIRTRQLLAHAGKVHIGDVESVYIPPTITEIK